MRSMICADWSFGIKGAIADVVRSRFPADLRLWPLLTAFDSEGYEIEGRYLILVLRDKLSGIPSGPGTPAPFPHDDHPSLPPTAQDAETWQAYLNRKLSVRPEDAAMVLPIHDSGKNSAPEDFKLFTAEEQSLWQAQLALVICRQKAHVSPDQTSPPSTAGSVVYNISGTNNRVVINSRDESVNVFENVVTVFEDLRKAAADRITDNGDREQVLAAIRAMESAHGSPEFLTKYQRFMALAADHVSVFGGLLGALSALL